MKSLRLKSASMVGLGMLLSAIPLQGQTAQLGRIDFPTSGSHQVQEIFLRGVLLLHSFEYGDALEAFREAQERDPDFAMAYWGEAMTYNHPLWRQQEPEKARAALNRFAPTPEARLAKTPSDREKGLPPCGGSPLWRGGKARPATWPTPEQCADSPNSTPMIWRPRSFYALSILGTAQAERDFRIYMRAGGVAEEVFARNPRHPGAVHYLIHSYDDPIHAPLGLRAARVYAEIAPAATHAQHMISHIYVALGSWDEVISANIKSFAGLRRAGEAQGIADLPPLSPRPLLARIRLSSKGTIPGRPPSARNYGARRAPRSVTGTPRIFCLDARRLPCPPSRQAGCPCGYGHRRGRDFRRCRRPLCDGSERLAVR